MGRTTCSATCRKRVERARRWEQARAALRAKYPGLTLEQIFQAQQQEAWERWTRSEP